MDYFDVPTVQTNANTVTIALVLCTIILTAYLGNQAYSRREYYVECLSQVEHATQVASRYKNGHIKR